MQTRFLFDSGPVPGSENDTDPDSAYHFDPNADPNFWMRIRILIFIL
jgi:hypothetical protein